jgi:hypothetical protein
MKKYKLWLFSLALMTALMVNVSPVRVYADDSDPQGTSQKKATPQQDNVSPELIAILMTMLRMWW